MARAYHISGVGALAQAVLGRIAGATSARRSWQNVAPRRRRLTCATTDIWDRTTPRGAGRLAGRGRVAPVFKADAWWVGASTEQAGGAAGRLAATLGEGVGERRWVLRPVVQGSPWAGRQQGREGGPKEPCARGGRAGPRTVV